MTTQPDRSIRSILVCGGGIVAWSAALAFARALPMVRLRVLEVGMDDAALADLLPTCLPSVGRFHAAARIDELVLVRAGAAIHHLGTRFDQWSADGASWIHAHGEYGMPNWPVTFRDLWTRAKATGEADPVHHYSAAGVMAEAEKFVHPRHDGKWPLSTYRYGLRFDRELYLDFLRREALASEVELIQGELKGIQRGAPGIASLVLTDGQKIEADLFIDCSGPAARLLSAVDDRFDSWADLFPFDHLEMDSVEGFPSPTETLTASGDGWAYMIPSPRRTLVLRASRSEGVRIHFGWRPQSWVGNVVAFGDAAVCADPIHGVNLHLAHSAIMRALELLPGRDFHPLELAEYNRRADQEATRARDFGALHYLRSGRTDAAWGEAAKTVLPESLAHTLDQFEERGRLPFYEQESFTVDSWSAVLLALGVRPNVADPTSGRFPLDGSIASLRGLAQRLKALPEQLPAYPDYLEQIRRGDVSISSPAAA